MSEITNELPESGRELNLFLASPCRTTEIQQLSNQIAHLIRCGLPGASVYGVQRIGKSHCADYLRRVALELGAAASSASVPTSVGHVPKAPPNLHAAEAPCLQIGVPRRRRY